MVRHTYKNALQLVTLGSMLLQWKIVRGVLFLFCLVVTRLAGDGDDSVDISSDLRDSRRRAGGDERFNAWMGATGQESADRKTNGQSE